MRIIGGMASGVGLVLLDLVFLTSDQGRLPYLVMPIILFTIAWIALTLVWIMPAREGRSMMGPVMESWWFAFAERARLKTSANGSFSGIGVSAIDDDGLVHFSSGDVGLVYATEGQIGPSTLPQIAKDIALYRHRWLLGREATSSHMLLTTVSRKDAFRQFDYYNRCYKDNKRQNTIDRRAAAHYAEAQYKYTDFMVHDKDIHISQFEIIRDVDEHTLRTRTQRMFENWAANGMLARADLLVTQKEVQAALEPLALVGNKGK